MKIAFWNSGFFGGYGGAELCTAELINTLAGRGETCFLLANTPGPAISSILPHDLDERIVVRRGAFHNPLEQKKNPIVFLYRVFRYLISACSLLAWLIRQRVDVIHLHFVSLDVVMLVWLKRLLGYRLVLTFHGMELELAHSSTLSNWKNRLALKNADHVTAVSRHQCDVLRKIDPACPVHYIPNALDSDRIHQLASQPSSLPIESGQFVFCGRVDPEKQVLGLVEAFELAIRQGCSRKLYIMGDGVDFARVQCVIVRLDIAERIILLGAQERHYALRMISECRCLLLNSSSEGYPMVILEAMVLGKPVIAPDIGGIGDMVSSGDNAMLFPAGDTDALCSAILDLDRHEDKAERLGENARTAVAVQPDLDTVVSRYIELYRS